MDKNLYARAFSIEQATILFSTMPIRVWDRWGPIIIELRDYIGSPDAYLSFEYLSLELRKYQESDSHLQILDAMRQSVNNR